MSETGMYIGSFAAVGYTMNQQTPSFTYTDMKTYTDNSLAIPPSQEAVWSAAAKVGLNDCTVGSTWTLWAGKNASGNGLSWGAGIKKGGAGSSASDMDADCSVLTPQFINLRN